MMPQHNLTILCVKPSEHVKYWLRQVSKLSCLVKILLVAILLVACSRTDTEQSTSLSTEPQQPISGEQSEVEITSSPEQITAPVPRSTSTNEPPIINSLSPAELKDLLLFPAAVKEGQNILYGYIDIKGIFIIPPQFRGADYFDEDVAFVTTVDGYSRLIDKSGKFISDTILLGDYRPFSEGLAAVWSFEDKAYGYIDHTGVFVIPPQFEKAEDFHNGYAIVTLQEGGKTYIDTQGNIILTPHGYLTMRNFNSGVAVISQLKSRDEGPRFTVINTKGERVVPLEFSMIYGYREGFALASREEENEWGYLDTNGDFAIEPRFGPYSSSFSEGRAFVTAGDGRSCGYIDYAGSQIIEPIYTKCTSFSEGIAWVKQIEDTWQAIDLDGKILFGITADQVSNFNEGMAMVLLGTEYGFINIMGEVIFAHQGALLQPFRNGLAKFELISMGGRSWGYINKDGEIIYQMEY